MAPPGNPDLPIDTNHLERTLRPIPMGRKNWLFCWTELGAERVGQIQSLIATCVLHEIECLIGVDRFRLLRVFTLAVGNRMEEARALVARIKPVAQNNDYERNFWDFMARTYGIGVVDFAR
jgi:hypothetical protein